MEINRNQYFMVGLVLLFLGFQVRMVETFVLNDRASRFIAERLTIGGDSLENQQILPAAGPTPRRTLRPPAWLGYALVSIGAVLVLHSLAMKRRAVSARFSTATGYAGRGGAGAGRRRGPGPLVLWIFPPIIGSLGALECRLTT